MTEYDKYLTIIRAECVSHISSVPQVILGTKYRLGIRYNQLLKKEVYYILDIKSALGMPVYVEMESGYFKEEELSSISFIMA